jgi:cytochrome c-type biogenesis protein CcmF
VKVGVGPPFYEQITAPIFLALIILMGVCPLIGWRKASTENLLRNFLIPTVAGAGTFAMLYAGGLRHFWAGVAFGAAAFVAAAILLEFYRGVRMRIRHGDNFLIALPRLVWRNKPRYGGYIVHIGVILMVIGIAGSMFFSTNVQKQVATGESIEIRGYTLTFQGLTDVSTEHTQKITGTLAVSRDGKQLGTIEGSKRVEGHAEDAQPVTDVGIRSRPLEDLYVILASWTEDEKAATFKVLVNPLMMWVWIGATVLVVGTIIAFWPDRRERQAVPARQRVAIEGLEASRA